MLSLPNQAPHQTWAQPWTDHQSTFAHPTAPQALFSSRPLAHSTLPKALPAGGPAADPAGPSITMPSVLALSFEGGVLVAADTRASYGSMAEFAALDRVVPLTSHAAIAFSGDVADAQHLTATVQSFIRQEFIRDSHAHLPSSLSPSPSSSAPPSATAMAADAATATATATVPDGAAESHVPTPSELASYVQKIMYGRRTRMQPLWTTLIVAGWDVKLSRPSLTSIDLRGTSFTAPSLATGIGADLAQPIFRRVLHEHGGKLSLEDATKAMKQAITTLYARHTAATNSYRMATITKDGVHMSEIQSVQPQWEYGASIRGFGADPARS